jgi:Family of unknown function (DUF6940)
MDDRVTRDACPTSAYSTEMTPLDGGRVSHFRLRRDGGSLSWFDVVDRWQNDATFRRFFISVLVDSPFHAYFWETPSVTDATINREFEFVLVDSQQLVGVRTDERAFANHFTSVQPDESVIEFSNLGGDATLVVPCPRGPLSAYSQLSTFVRMAPDDQQHQLWTMVGAALERQLGSQPVWLSTSGLGIYWLHIRLDSTPKYFTHDPYRAKSTTASIL